MKRLLFSNSFYFVVFFVVVTLVKDYFDFYYISLWIGGILGFFIPDLDQLVYIYFLEPEDTISVNARDYFKQKKFLSTFRMLVETKANRTKLIFHTFQFNLFFLALTFFVTTSSGSIFGHGLTLAFCLKLFIEQYGDYKKFGNLDKWFSQVGLSFDSRKLKFYLLVNLLLILIFGLYI